MIRPNLRLALAIGLVASGCSPTHRQAVRPSKPGDDPTSWSAPTVTKGDDDSATKGAGKPSRLAGGWSSEANDIERSLGAIR